MGKKELKKLAQKPLEKLENVFSVVESNLTIAGSLVIAFLGYLLYRTVLPMKVFDNQNKDIDTLKFLLMGEDPGIFYCHRGVLYASLNTR